MRRYRVGKETGLWAWVLGSPGSKGESAAVRASLSSLRSSPPLFFPLSLSLPLPLLSSLSSEPLSLRL